MGSTVEVRVLAPGADVSSEDCPCLSTLATVNDEEGGIPLLEVATGDNVREGQHVYVCFKGETDAFRRLWSKDLTGTTAVKVSKWLVKETRREATRVERDRQLEEARRAIIRR